MLPQLIGIAGPSCAGKTTLANALLDQLPGSCTVLSLDAYYRDFSQLSPAARAAFNFDAPTAIDHELLTRDISQLASGHSIKSPVYDFATHARQLATKRIVPGNFLLIEGLFALYWSAINPLYYLRIFVVVDDALCLERRLLRDRAERGRSAASIHSQYREQVRPMYQRHIHPTAQTADLLLEGHMPLEQQVQKVLVELA